MILSVIIPAYNEEKYIGFTIENIMDSIKKLSISELDWEIIVCDNNSNDKTAEIAKTCGAKVIFEPQNQISKARNTGAGIAKGAWLLFIDADTYPDESNMAEIFSVIKHNKLIGCGTTIKVVDGSLVNRLRMERLNPFFRLFNIAGGAFLLTEKKGFNAVKGFSNNLYAYEEFDFIFKLKRYGKSMGKKFKVLNSNNPVVTSGRKGELTLGGMARLIFSNFFALMLFGLSYIFPSRIIQKAGKNLLGFWYKK